MSRFEPNEWDFEEETEENAKLLMLAAFGRAYANAIDEGEFENLSAIARKEGDINGYSFADGLAEMEPVPDEGLWRYIASKIWWGWRYGMEATRFDHADDLQLGLPVDRVDEKTGLRPGQLDRVAQPGIDEYWRVADGVYQPTLRLIRKFPGEFPEIEP